MTKIAIHLLAASAIFGLTGAAQAADLGGPFKAPTVVQPLVDTVGGSGWYLRGDIGIGATLKPTMYSDGPAGIDTNASASWMSKSMADTPFIDIGVGYQFTDYLRGDLTAEYRADTRFRGNARYPRTPTDVAYPFYDGGVSSTVVLANAYADLGNYNGLTPYVGAGIGAAYNKMGDTFQHTSFPAFGTYADGVFPGQGKWNLAWALHTGISWDVNPRLKLEMGYSYKSLGTVKSGDLRCNDNPAVNTKCNEWLSLKNLASNDMHIGMRWLLTPPEPKAPVYAPMPVVAKY